MSARLRLKNHVRKNEIFHFSKMGLGPLERSSLHDHDFSELFWVESGRVIHWIRGEKRMIDPGTLIFVRPEDFHTVGAADPKEESVICNLAFPSRVWRFIRQRYLRKQPDWYCGGAAQKREHILSPVSLDFLRRAGLEMISAPRSGLMLERFFLNLAVALQPPEALSSIRAPHWLTGAVSRVEHEGLFRKGPGALTQMSGRSQEHVVRESKRWLHKTPTILINEMRMRHAAAHLSTTQQEIIDICYDCGLENVGHFYTLFRQTYGMTPRRYRLSSQSIVKPVNRG
jgi:AraC-like DNA-binding protein/quercetin dioxygenase-like cupin family protein